MITLSKYRRVYLALFIAIFGFCLLNTLVTPKAEAVSASDWNPGRIIDDSVFFNKDSMTPLQIQAFLNSKVPVCDTNHQASFWMNGVYNAPPYTCLKDYSSGGKSAAQIIWEAGQANGVNPQSLIVMLQKETGLVTDTWAAPWQYDRAMGYGCPDTADCDTAYYGFSNQVNNAARQLRRYVTYPDSYNFKSGVTRNIQWSPNGACGSSPVYIENPATAALYNYTPYQPNQAALNNMYGTGDGCSAYGNRNFWRQFNDWFGSTSGSLFSAGFNAQSVYPSLNPGETKTVYIQYQNQGAWDWHDDAVSWPGIPPIHLAATNAINRQSIFSYGWPSAGRPSNLFNRVYESDGTTLSSNQHLVKPGQIARFEFTITAPWTLAPGTYREYFQPVLEGASGWNIGGVSWLDITINPDYRATFHAQSPSLQTTKGVSAPAYLQYKNTGSQWWRDDTITTWNGTHPVHLAATNPVNKNSPFSYNWPSAGRPNLTFSKVYEADGTTLSNNQHVVKPGQIGRFEFNLTPPWALAPGTHREYFQPVLEGANKWNIGGFSWLDLSVKP